MKGGWIGDKKESTYDDNINYFNRGEWMYEC